MKHPCTLNKNPHFMTFMKIYIESGEEKAELEQIESIPFVIKKKLDCNKAGGSARI